jgi:hypothetical protein
MGEAPVEMSSGTLQDRADRLAALVHELGAAMRSSGVDDDAASRLLENASAAVLDALTLDLMFTGDVSTPPGATPVEEPPVKPMFPRAA